MKKNRAKRYTRCHVLRFGKSKRLYHNQKSMTTLAAEVKSVNEICRRHTYRGTKPTTDKRGLKI